MTNLNWYYESHLNPEVYRSSDGCDFSQYVRLFRPEKLPINCNNINEVKIGKLIGKGSGREVYEGDWHGSKVAVKIDNDRAVKRIDKITKEAAVLYKLRRYPNIIHIVGWCNTTIVLEKVDGNLGEMINSQHISIERALEMSLDIAKGVQQMHTLPWGAVTHGDIKQNQFLYNRKGKILLGDLDRMEYTGLSNINEKCKFYSVKGDGPFDEKVDIYWIAVIMRTISHRVNDDTSEYPQAVLDLVGEALDDNTIKRPSATEMVERIEAMLRNYKTSHVWSFLFVSTFSFLARLSYHYLY